MSDLRNRSLRGLSRRTLLRGAGVALSLPWLDSLLTREARAQAAAPILRYLPIFLPLGAPDIWKPQSSGAGAAWQLSSILEPLTALKAQLSVISGLENGSVFNADGSSTVEPPHGRQSGAWLTCEDAAALRERVGALDVNGVSVDQLIAARPGIGDRTALPSLQVGLSTTMSSCDGQPCSLSRSVSWQRPLASPSGDGLAQPLYKEVDPGKVFDMLVSGSLAGQPAPDAIARKAAQKSVLDAVMESAAVVKPKLSGHDKQRLDEFFEAVRSVERRLEAPSVPGCGGSGLTRPNFAPLGSGETYQQNGATYDKALHAELMNDLIVLAFQCDATRVISYMLEDENSEFVYDFVPRRTFTATSSAPGQGFCGVYSSAQHGSVDEFASITQWNVSKVADLCQKLAAVVEGDGRSLLDSSVVFLGACMHGSNHACADLPALLLGSGGGMLETDQHIELASRPMRDFHYTIMNGVFGLGVTDFGVNRTGAPLALIEELLT